jgi:hypothetical protein
MSKFGLLLRIVLSAGLILNGSSSASAAVRMQDMTPLSLSIDRVSAAAQHHAFAPPCHGGSDSMRQQAAKVLVPGLFLASANQQQKQETPAPDCCKSGHCQCPCLLYFPITAAAEFWNVTTWKVLAVHSLTTTHVSPTLSRLIRPPIA